MKDLLKFESRKLFHAKILYICIIIVIAVLLLFMGVQKLTDVLMEEISGAESDLFLIGTGNSGLSWMLSSLTPYVVMVFGVFTAVYVCGDFGNGTIKNIFSRGYSRTEVYFSKYLISLFVQLGFGLVAMLVGFLGGTLMWRIGGGWSAKVILLVLIQLVGIAAYNALFCFFAALLKKMAPTMILAIATPFAFSLILSLLDLLIESRRFNISDYWISGCISSASSIGAREGDMIRGFVIALVYIGIFTVCGWLLARKREV